MLGIFDVGVTVITVCNDSKVHIYFLISG